MTFVFLLGVSLWMQPPARFAFVTAVVHSQRVFSLSPWPSSVPVQPKSGEPRGAAGLCAGSVSLQGHCHAAGLGIPPQRGQLATGRGQQGWFAH